MSSMPERGTPDQSGASTERSAGPGEWGTPSQGSAPGQERFGAAPAGSSPGQPEPGQPGGQEGGWAGESAAAPVTEAETRVTWRRIFQYWIDAFFVSVIPYLVSIPFDRSASTIMHIIGGVVYVILFVLIGLWYWVIRPHSHNGQTFAMKWFGLRVISKDGGPASLLQLFVRWICLLFDSAPWMWPFTGLLGLIVMLCSRYRQRIGDHLAKTLVIRTAGTRYGEGAGPGDYGRTGTAQPVQSGAGQETGVGRQPEHR
ncbi:MAG TPA: RDD family protein [Streptosporangiaceae bacterium]|nr:RDD family protein [Streptosporangiaceae bacterium]